MVVVTACSSSCLCTSTTLHGSHDYGLPSWSPVVYRPLVRFCRLPLEAQEQRFKVSTLKRLAQHGIRLYTQCLAGVAAVIRIAGAAAALRSLENHNTTCSF